MNLNKKKQKKELYKKKNSKPKYLYNWKYYLAQKKNKNNLESIDFTNKKIHITSPYSKKALLELGLYEKDLYEISLKEYLAKHPELKVASFETQNKRYEHYNERRLKSIDAARKIRLDLIDSEMKKNEINEDSENSNNDSEEQDLKKEEIKNYKDTQEDIIKREYEKLELMKKQQLGEIKNMIEYEFKQKEAKKRTIQKEK